VALKVHDPNEVSDVVVERWSKELANRRQYLGFLKTLQEEINLSKNKIQQIYEKIQLELVNVKALVSNKNSVPKEVSPFLLFLLIYSYNYDLFR